MLEIIDPSDWIKNTSFIVEDKNMPHRIAMSFFDDNYVNQLAGVQAFNFKLKAINPNDKFLFTMQQATLQIMEETIREHANITSLSILSVHDEMEVALVLLESIIKVPAFLNLKVAAAIATDTNVWVDVMLNRSGLVDLNKTTVFELRRLFDEDDLNKLEKSNEE